MKAADGVQIAERWAKAYAAAKAKESEHGWAGEPWACILVTAIEELSAAEERERVLREEVKKANLWLAHRQQVIDNFFSTLIPEQRTAAPEQGKEAKS